jgi:hypothetical protein
LGRRTGASLTDDAADVVIDADLVRLSQAFDNILNANVNATPEGDVVAVSASANKDFEWFPTSSAQSSDDGLPSA